jgi:hypothetical protein
MGLPDPDLELFCTDPDPSINEQKIIKNLGFCCLVTSLMTFHLSLKTDVNVGYLQKAISKTD